MGNEELNFTEDEACCWADDPRNQPARHKPLPLTILILALLIGAALIVFAWLENSGTREPHGALPAYGHAPLNAMVCGATWNTGW